MARYNKTGVPPVTNTDNGSGLAGYFGRAFRARVLATIPENRILTDQVPSVEYNTESELFADQSYTALGIDTIAEVLADNSLWILSRFVDAQVPNGPKSIIWDRLFNWADDTFYTGIAIDLAGSLISDTQSDPIVEVYQPGNSVIFKFEQEPNPNTVVVHQSGLRAIQKNSLVDATEYVLQGSKTNMQVKFGAVPLGPVILEYHPLES